MIKLGDIVQILSEPNQYYEVTFVSKRGVGMIDINDKHPCWCIKPSSLKIVKDFKEIFNNLS